MPLVVAHYSTAQVSRHTQEIVLYDMSPVTEKIWRLETWSQLPNSADICVQTEYHKSGAIELLLVKIRTDTEGQIANNVFPIRVLSYLTQDEMSRCCGLYINNTKFYGHVAKMTRQRQQGLPF
jgi:hypothetical protein